MSRKPQNKLREAIPIPPPAPLPEPENIDFGSVFNEYAAAAREAFNAKYFNAKEGFYGNNTVTANLES